MTTGASSPPVRAHPRVSMIVAMYNGAATIEATLASCVAQTLPEFEIVTVNDGSTDDGGARVETFAPRVRQVKTRNGGLASARNVGMKETVGEYVAWMDSDDLCLPERLAIEAAVLDRFPDAVLVASDFSAFSNPAHDIEASHVQSYYRTSRLANGVAHLFPASAIRTTVMGAPVYVADMYDVLVGGNFLHPPTVMARRTASDRAGAFDETLRFNSDYDFILRLARLGPVAYIDRPLLRYRLSSAQMSHASAGGLMPLETLRILDKLCREDPDFAHRKAALLRARRSQALNEAAEMMAQTRRLKALGLLARGVASGPVTGAGLRTLAKILLPREVIRAAKKAFLAPAAPDA